MPYVQTEQSLPRSLDVQITLSRPQAETRTRLDILCVACEDLGFIPNANRVRFYSSMAAVETDFAAGTDAHFAASAFFSQTPRAPTLAIGEVFLDDLPAQLVSAVLSATEIAAVELVTDGSFDITYYNGGGSTEDPVEYSFTGLNFSGVTTIEGIVAIIDGACPADLLCTTKTLPGGAKRIVLATTLSGDEYTITYPVAGVAGTFVGALLNLTEAEGGSLLQGYTSTGIADELSSIQNAAGESDYFIYGWCLEAGLRDAVTQTAVAEWALARTAVTTLVTNDVNALDPTYEDDIGSVLAAAGNRRAVALYHDNAQRYPDVSILAYMLSVNYRLQDSAVTAKFKQLPGIEAVVVTETEWAALQAKGYNTYTAIGNDARTYRDGTTEDVSWFMDSTINLDNFVEDLSVNVFNVFLRNKKIPYSRKGQMLLVDACRDTGNLYTYNGVFADREVADTTKKSGYEIVPAVQVLPTPISNMSVADRASRIGPPIEMIVQEAGAIHSVAVNVEVVS